MQKLKFLNRREVKEILDTMHSQWGFEGELDFVFMLNSKNKIYIINREIEKVELSGLRIDSIGMYFGEITDHGLRLSVEGSQLVGKSCAKNIIDLSDDEFREWLKGNDLHKTAEGNGFVLIRHNSDFVGCGKVGKDKIHNYLSKARRVNVAD